MDDTLYLKTYPELLGEKLGSGSFGHVYASKLDPSMCIKMSNKQNDVNYCRQWSNEYHKIITLTTRLEEDSRYKKLSFVKIIKPTEFVESSTLCYMEMPRIFRPVFEDDDKKNEFVTVQPQLGHKNVSIIHRGRGQFVGLKQIKPLFEEDDLEKACYELGVMIGLIHYVGKNNALDTELFLGREYKYSKYRFYIADFDLTTEIKQFNDKTIEELRSSLSDIPYYPKPSVNRKLFTLFYNGYCAIVPSSLAERVFIDYD